MDPLEVLRQLEGDGPKPSDDAIAKAREELAAALDLATSADVPDLETAKELREGIDRITAEQGKREEAVEAARAEARKLREGLFPEKGEEAPAEAETEEVAEEVAEPVAAAPRISIADRLASRMQKFEKEEPTVEAIQGTELRPIGMATGFELDSQAGFGQLGSLFATHAIGVNSRGKEQKFARLTRNFSDDRILGNNVDVNNSRINKLMGVDAPLTASGGLCGPGDVDHSHPICGELGRPVRDSLPSFQASRGSVTFAPSAGLGDMVGATSIWTAATDANPGTATKPCPPVACPEEITATVDAITRCLTVGNFQAKFSPEFWASRLQLLMVAFEREAEQKAIEEIHAASTVVATTEQGNIVANFLQAVNRAIAADRGANRLARAGYTVLADAWVRDAMRNQVIENLGVANNIDVIQLADARIDSWLSAIGARAVWTYDGTVNPTTGDHNVQTDPLAFLAQTTVYVYPSDAFLFLDGGTLDLGTQIHDSALNATNDRQAFAESFEKVAFRGCSSYAITMPVSKNCGCFVPAP